jgi:pyridoxal phosphate enzyme (YggS family)
MTELAERVASLRARIRRACEQAGRPVEDVELGFRRFGENYVQEGVAKAVQVPEAGFLLIGPLQRNKARPALGHFQEILSLDRPELASRLRLIAAETSLVRPVWIQLELWGEASKQGGCDEAGLAAVVAALEGDSRLPLQGFMAIPPPGDVRPFQDLAGLRDRWQDRLGIRLRLSMGMSGDLEAAIQAGSDQVRVGTDFFGERTRHA